MGYRKFQADRLFNGYQLLSSDQVLIADAEGQVVGIVASQDAGDDVQKLPGILCPGFINCHCHLELSHLKNVIPPGTGLIEFLCSVVTKRDTQGPGSGSKMRSINAAELEMYNNGIVAVGDICNTADTAEVKSRSKLRWQNFVEVLGFTDEKADNNIAHYKQVVSELESRLATSGVCYRSSLVPHAPYSISPRTFRLLNELTAGKVISLHNQEHPAEDELYRSGGGDYLRLFQIFGIDKSPFPVTGKSSIRSCLPYFNAGQTILLIHNTYMPAEDISFANAYAAENNLTLAYCFCPNANLYIENRLPAIENFIRRDCLVVLGTDSYSSNWQLSIAREIQALVSMPGFGSIASLELVLQWATINGAKALRWDDQLGSFEKGKKPGVALLDTNGWSSQKLI